MPLLILVLENLQRSCKIVDTIAFSGYSWEIKTSNSFEKRGPGPNNWSSNNIWVDKKGYLHLKITQQNGIWYCAEIYTTKRLGFGEYRFYVISPIDRFDPNVVLGMFSYTDPSIGPDGTNEIDIEIARWANTKNPNGNFTVYPAIAQINGVKLKQVTYPFNFSLQGVCTTLHRFVWTKQQIYFQSSKKLLNEQTNEQKYEKMSEWYCCRSEKNNIPIPQTPLSVHINLWLHGGKPPTDLREVEVIISKFEFKPLSTR